MSRPFASPAWILRGLTGNVPGWLRWDGKRLRFEPGDSEGASFDLSRDEIRRIWFPWYYFGGGMKLEGGGGRHRVSFVRPNGAEVAIGRTLSEAGNPAGLLVAVEKVQDISTGRAAGRRWRAVLEGVGG